MPNLQNTRAQVRQEIHDQVRDAVQAAQDAANQAGQTGQLAQPAGQSGKAPTAPQAPVVIGPLPEGGGRLVIDRVGNRTVITSAALPPELLPMTRIAQETALGLMGLLAAIFILGPFARMFARRVDRRAEIKAAGEGTHLLNQQILQLQQSVDAMSLELERIGESQRFQSKLLNERVKG